MFEEDPKPHSQNLRLHREKETPGTFFFTKCLEPRLAILTDKYSKIIVDALIFYASKEQIGLGAFVVMLDHWHALLATIDGKTIKKRMEILDYWISTRTNDDLALQGTHWEDGYFDTKIKSAKQFRYVRNYIEENPVRAGLIPTSSDWPWSSAHPSLKQYIAEKWPWKFEKD
jgi:putative transposase